MEWTQRGEQHKHESRTRNHQKSCLEGNRAEFELQFWMKAQCSQNPTLIFLLAQNPHMQTSFKMTNRTSPVHQIWTPSQQASINTTFKPADARWCSLHSPRDPVRPCSCIHSTERAIVPGLGVSCSPHLTLMLFAAVDGIFFFLKSSSVSPQTQSSRGQSAERREKEGRRSSNSDLNITANQAAIDPD